MISSERRTGGGQVKFDYRKLRGKIREVYETQDKFAEKLGIGRVSLSQRLNNLLDFSQREIMMSCVLLGIPIDESYLYFFTLEVQKDEQNNKKEGE